ncbi:hypothetical protein CHUAL_004125 [Chamberlinius hualienensis]
MTGILKKYQPVYVNCWWMAVPSTASRRMKKSSLLIRMKMDSFIKRIGHLITIECKQDSNKIPEDQNDPDHSIVIRHFRFIFANGFRVKQVRKIGIIYGKYSHVDGNDR